MTDDQPRQSISPAALSLADAARLLTKVGGQPVTEDMLRDDMKAGAPTNPDGTLNLVHFAAWLLKEMSGAD
jgi:hypothetical protein